MALVAALPRRVRGWLLTLREAGEERAWPPPAEVGCCPSCLCHCRVNATDASPVLAPPLPAACAGIVRYVASLTSEAAPLEQFDATVEEMRGALNTFMTGDPGSVKSLYSRREDITLANPFGPPRRGWTEVENALERAAANFRDGRVIGYDEVSKYVTPDLGYILQIEKAEAKIGDSEELSSISLRVTMIFRREGHDWKMVHRHADPITTARAAESLIQN